VGDCKMVAVAESYQSDFLAHICYVISVKYIQSLQ